MEWRVPLADIDIGEEEIMAVTDVLHSRWLSMGAVTQQFEQEFAVFVGAKHALAVTNCTAALHLACLASDIGPGDEVILPSFSFVATANAIRYCGATPVFADVENLDSLTISPASIESLITERTRAILVMHYAGFACDMPSIMKIAQLHHLVVLEDSAHAIGSTLDGRTLGTWGSIGCYSFFSNKNMTTAEGGMVVTDDDALAERLKILRSHGMTTLSWERHNGHASTYDVVDLGYNYRIDEIRSALGRVQLGKLKASNRRRGELTALYRELLSELTPQIQMPFDKARGVSCFHILPVLLPHDINRAQFMEGMKGQGIQTSIHYPPIHRFQIYEDDWSRRLTSLPVTDDVSARQVTLPLYASMQGEQVEWVVRAAGKVLKEMQ